MLRKFLCAFFVLASLAYGATPTLVPVPSFTSPPANWGSLTETHLLNDTSRRYGHAFPGFVESGGTAPTSGNLTHVVVATVAYPGGYPVTAPATSLTYANGFRNYVFLYSIDGAVAGDFTVPSGCSIAGGTGMASGIVAITAGGSFVNVQCGTTREAPSLIPTNSQYGVVPLFYADTSGNAITAVVNQRPTSPLSSALGTVNVKDFGARCDGATDDLTAFNNTTNAARGGWVIFIPPCNNYYRLSNTWLVSGLSQISIMGAGLRSMIVIDNAAGGHAIDIEGSPMFSISNLTFSGIVGSGNAIRVGNVSSSSRGSIRHVFIRGVDGHAINIQNGLATTIINPVITTNLALPYAVSNMGNVDSGIFLSGSGANASTIIAPVIEGAGQYGVDVGNAAQGITILGGTIEGNNVGELRLTNNDIVYVSGTYFETSGLPGGGISVLDGSRNVTFDTIVSSGTNNIVNFVDCDNCVLRNSLVNAITIGSLSERVRLQDLSYGQQGGDITDNGLGSIIENVFNSSNAHRQQAGKTQRSRVNFAENPSFESWSGATTLTNWAVYGSGTTIAKAGPGQTPPLDASARDGRFSVNVAMAAVHDANEGIRYTGSLPAYATDFLNKRITVSVWAMGVTAAASFHTAMWYDSGQSVQVCSHTSLSTTTWTKYSCTFPWRSGMTVYDVRLAMASGDPAKAATTIRFDAIRITLGEDEAYGVNDNLQQAAFVGYHALTPFSATPTFYPDAVNMWSITLTGNVTAIALSGGQIGRPLWLRFVQSAGGGNTIGGWPASVRWVGGVAPVLTATASRSDVYCLLWDGTNWWECGRLQNQF